MLKAYRNLICSVLVRELQVENSQYRLQTNEHRLVKRSIKTCERRSSKMVDSLESFVLSFDFIT